MKIIKKPSPNFNRRAQILMIHATGVSLEESFVSLIDGAVSCHYVIDDDGTTYQLVDEDKRAWHAGQGCWNGITDVNCASIGVELVKPSDDEVILARATAPEKLFDNVHYSVAQMSALIELSKNIMKRHEKIIPKNVIAHQDSAVSRKFDPGRNFNWKVLAENGIGLWHDLNDADMADTTPVGEKEREKAIDLFKNYGYDLRSPSPEQVKNVVIAFQTHFLPEQISGTITGGTLKAIQSLYEKQL